MKPSVKRQIMLDTSFRLFKQHGFHATGVDSIIKESGTSKATLYKYFKTKELLILAVLQDRHKMNMQDSKNAIESNLSQSEPVLGIFDAYHKRFQQYDFFGCLFIRAATEFNQKKSVINKFTIQVKTDLMQLLIKHLKIGSRNQAQAEEKANCLMILIDGAIINAQMCKNKNAAIEAKRIASFLLK